jgi:4-hydroxythreonine-4-phosphate dehydrogenase
MALAPLDPATPARLPLALTMGDPAGIGPDITLQAWHARHERGLPPFAVYADIAVLRERAALLGLSTPLVGHEDLPAGFAAYDEALAVIAVPAAGSVVPGRPSRTQAGATIAAIDLATATVQKGQARALVTNPIAKAVLYEAGFRHPGHTEYLAHLASHATGAPLLPVMMIASGPLKVVPVTIHIPLAAVPAALTPDLLRRTIEITHAGLHRDFGIARPRIAVAGLNPHAGENGALGLEDIEIIAPVIENLRDEGLDITGPHSADTLFHAAARTRYDAVVAMYHDQALIPIKTLAFDTGVNVTLGLPFVRTSPDHGTAFDIAGTGKASPESLIQALLMADRLAQNRTRP